MAGLLREGNITATQKDQRRGRRFPHFVQITLRPRKDGRAQQGGQAVDFSLAGMKVRVEGERLPGRVFRVFLPNSDPPQVCGVGEVVWERRMPHACEFGLAFRTTTTDYRDLIRALRQAVRDRSQAKAGLPRIAVAPKIDDEDEGD
jgi:hypothetical protein